MRVDSLVLRVDAGVADVRIGQRDDLAAVGGIGEDLLVAGHRGVEHDLADRQPGCADGAAPKHRPVGEDEGGGGKLGHENSRSRCKKAGEACAPPARFEARNYTATGYRQAITSGQARRSCRRARALAAQVFGRAQRAQGIGHAALRADRHFDPLPGAGEDHAVLADDVAAADGMKTDLPSGCRSPVSPSRPCTADLLQSRFSMKKRRFRPASARFPKGRPLCCDGALRQFRRRSRHRGFRPRPPRA